MSNSMIDTNLVQKLSDALLKARASRTPIVPLTESHPDLSVADAYAIAQHGVKDDLNAGAKIVGHKIGLTAVAVQQQLGVDTPDYGTLLNTMDVSDFGRLYFDEYIAPRIELELAFTLGKRLQGPGITSADVRAATRSVHPAIEIVDSRIADWRIALTDTVADRASSAAFVVGTEACGLADIDITGVEVQLSRNGEIVESGTSKAVLGDPAAAVAWLANALGELGESLEAGEIVLSGACTKMVTISPGDEYNAWFDGLGELTLAVL